MASGLPKTTPTPRLFSRETLKSFTLLPSKFLREKFLSMKKKAITGGSILPRIGPRVDQSETRQKLPSAPRRLNLLQASPPEMVFQNFVVHEASEMAVSLINKGKNPQVVKVSMESSPYFQLMGSNNAYRVVLPGASTPVRIRFTPNKNKDYSHQFICTTIRERVVVPIRAIRARAILELPKYLDFTNCPVKYNSQKTLLVHNVGNRATRFQLSTKSPFSVVPTTGTVGAGDTVEVTVGFHPLKNDDYCKDLCCNTGEEIIKINLYGDAIDFDIGFTTNSVEVEKTFITMSNYRTMRICNRSRIKVQFQWKAFPTEEDENEEKRRQQIPLEPRMLFLDNLIEEKKEKVNGFWEDRTTLPSNIAENLVKMPEDPLLFSDDVFFIEPMEGEIEPYSSAEVKVTFKPLEAIKYQSIAYCNISGLESRLPLHLRGEGQEPLVAFSCHTLNLDNIFINFPHVCEVKLVNKGDLDAPFTYIPSTTKVGFPFKFEPEEGIIAAGGTQTVQVSFSPTVLGCFEEEFHFSVAGSPVPAILTIKGSVTGPTLLFDVDELSFGDISFGFPYTQCCRLTNTSVVPVTFKLRMSFDGTQPAVDSIDQIRSDSDPSWRKGIHFYVEPREFRMNPSQGTILPQGHQDIEVTLCSNSVMEFYRPMLVDLEGIGKGVASLVISARCLVPRLHVNPEILFYDECRLKVPYERKFLVTNSTDLPGCYGLIPQKRKENSPVFYSSPKPCGIVQPHSFAEIPVLIEVQTLGKHRTSVLIGVFGDERNPLRAELRSSGELAEIYPSPRLIEFGTIPVLQPTSRSFSLLNESLVPTDFRIEMASRPQCFVIEPREGVIPARGEVPVTITAMLDDTGHFANSVRLLIGKSLWTACGLVALGTGTTIVIDKPFAPELNLGYQFSLLPFIHWFKVTNRGRRYHRLSWSMSSPEIISAFGCPRDDSKRPKCANPLLGLEPLSMELQPGQSADMVVQGFSPIPQEVQAHVMCEADSGPAIKTEKTKIIETVITCKYIEPSIEVSARHFSFRVEKKSSDILTRQYKPLSLKNTCLLPLDLMLDLEQPFLVCDEDQQPLPDGQPVRVDVGETCHLYIAFDPAYELNFKSWKKEKMLKINLVRDHPFVERIVLWGEVRFPHLHIQPSTLEFGCIVAGTEEVRSLKMTNCSSLPAQYHWSFHSSSQVYRLRYELRSPKFKPHPPKEKRTCLDSLAFQRRRFKIRTVEEPVTALEELWDIAQSLGAQVPPEAHEEYYIPQGLEGFGCSPSVPHTPLKAEEAFSILPLSGVLQPGESQEVSFTFSGPFYTIAHVKALCHVEGGPTYEVVLTGEASHMSYSLSLRKINCGFQMFNEIHHSNVTLENSGKIEFSWVLNPSPANKHLPGVFLVNPTTGSIPPGEKQVLEFSYMPGLPEAFSRTYQLTVGDLDPENICLKGEAFCPMISVNLPWNIKGNEKYEKPLTQFVKPVKQDSQRNKSGVRKKTQSRKTETLKFQTPKTQTPKSPIPEIWYPKPHVPDSGIAPDTQLQINTVRMLIEKAAFKLQEKLTSHPPKSTFPDKELCQSLVKVELPEYVLDMGIVRKGYTVTSALEITNPGPVPVSFQVDLSVLRNTGFSTNLEKVQGLPHSYTKMFCVRFQSARQPRGVVEVVLPIKVTKGPTYNIRLRATVPELSLELSKNTLQFSTIVVGQCKVETVRLYNWFRVPCTWCIKPVPKNNQHKYMTPAVRQKLQALVNVPCPFQVKPSKGTLPAGSWQNLQIQFTPKEEKSYKNELELSICGSSNRLKLHLSGQGLQPRLEFSPPALKMGWVLVDSDGVEATVRVKNPCNFPIEFYSLDFDEQYLEEEKILRMAVGSEYQKSFFMPPRAVGETLPPEVLKDYEAQRRPKAQQAKLKAMAEAKARAEAEAKAKAMGKAAAAYRTVTFCPESLVKMTGNPISRAVMRHLGIDPSSGRCEAQQHRGIVVIVHGPPRAGKTEVAAGLCQYYNAAYMSIDTVVKEAMANNRSPAGLCAWELCTKAAMELKDKDGGDAGKKPQLTAQTKNKQASGEKINQKYAKGKNPPAQKKEPASKPKIKDTRFTVSTAPAPQQLNIISSHGKELNCLSCVLPEDLLVDMLSERLKRKDCSKGVVFDGLESLFAGSLESSLLCILKAVKNCHHIYMVNLHQDYASWKAKEEAERSRKEAEREKEELQQGKAMQRNTENVLQKDEDEYDALPEEKKAEVDKILLERKSIQTEGELKQFSEKLEEKAKALEEEERRKEEEKQKKEMRGVFLGKQPEKQEKKETKSPEKKTKPPERKETKAPERKESKIPERKETKTPEKQETKIPQRKETQSLEKKETQAPERKETKIPQRKETQALEKKETKIPERKERKMPERKETKPPKKKETKAPERKETKIPERKETKTPGKQETKIPQRKETQALEKKETKIPERKERKMPEKITKIPEKKETKAPERNETKILERKETKTPEKQETKIPERKETQALEKKETKIPERKETKALKKETKTPEKEKKAPEKKEIKAPEKKETKIPEKKETKAPERKESKTPEKRAPSATEKGDTKAPQKRGTKAQQKRGTKASEKRATKAPKKGETKAPEQGEAKIPENPAEMEKNLILRFQNYESSQQDITQIFSYWDRVQGTVQLPVIQKGNKSQPSAENKDQKTSKPQEKPEHEHGGQRSLQLRLLGTQSKVAEGAVRDENVGVPCLDIQVTDPKAMIKEILRDGKLPTEDQMLKHLGLYPDGPPLPPAAVLSIVEYPEKRLGSAKRVKPFTIVAPEGAAVEDNLAKVPHAKGSSAKGQPQTGKAASRDSSAKEKQISTQRTGSSRDSSATRSKSTRESASTPTEFLRLVFPQWRETMEADEVIFKEYVESTKQFHFGPLLCGKSREWYKAQNCPGNSENITILNNCPVDAEIQFSFENTGEAETFLLDPPSMTLKPKEKQELTIWAYPTSPGFVEDKLICCIGKNPDPVVFSLCCHGVPMKLEVSPRELSFDKVLLHRTDSRTLVLRNNSLLPMAWQLNGLDDLVEDFSLSQENGTIDPHSEFEVTLQFKAGQIGSIEKTLQLEVSDTENILGIVQVENIEISAEVYDVSLSIDMPEGPDGSLEFGTINVLDNVKKVLSLKNKGVYDIEYSFTLKGAGPSMQDLASYFTIEPQSGVLIASQPGVNVEMLFHPTSEILLKNKAILCCQVIDPSSGEGGQAVSILLRVSAKAEYSKYSIVPASPADFGTMIKGTKKTRTVVLENKGMLSFKFHICQAPEDASALESKSSKQKESAPSATKDSTERKLSSSTQSHLSLGMFTVSPCSGSIGPWGQQMITVECLAGQEGTCEEQLYIDITGRDPRDNPLGIPFTLTAESCLPALVEDITLIFKEYLICSSTDLSHKLQLVKGTGLFIGDENKFIFNKVLVGQEAEAHFSIYSASRLPCDVVLSIKPLPGKEQIPINNIFKLDPVKMSVPGSSYAIATVTFTPPDEQNYDCTFKASLDIPKGYVEIKPQILTFTISGKGQKLPVTVVRPSARSKRGTAVLRFKRLRVGDSEMLPLDIHNDGIIPIKFMLRLEDEHGAFFLQGRASTLKIFHTGNVEEDSVRNESKPPKQPFFLLRRGQSTKFDVIFKPTLAQRLEGKIGLLVGDICMTLVELVGEGHKDEFTLDGLKEDTQERNSKSSLNKDIIDAVRVNHMQFGDCPVGKPCCRTFTMTNHTRTQFMRFEWEADGPFRFSPKVGHLHPGCAKSITVTLKADVPATFRRHLVRCKVTKINFELPQRKVPDWDDQMCIVTWKDTTRKDLAAKCPKKEKVIEPVPEPAHTVVEKSSQEVEVYLSAVVTCAQFKLSPIVVQFKDTLPFQTRTASFRLCNTGKVALEYSWEEAAGNEAVKEPNSTALTRQFLSSETSRRCRKLLHPFGWQQEHPFETHSSELGQLQQLAKQQQQPEQQDHSKKLCRSKCVGSCLEIFPDVVCDLPLFSIKPYHGILAPGQKQTFHVRFSPKCAGKFETTLLCRIPNLELAHKTGQVIVKGRAQERKSLDKQTRSALQQTEEGQGPEKQVLWKPASKGQCLCQLEPPAGTSNIVLSAGDGLPPLTRDLCSYPSKLQ
ncbi:hydrocephalus-inducing protein-like isoform X2 [Passer domesticus]|uniref:hydrocephalus-inducing protein-like isoform X2 n=1 Tax=Passer domesticus TaxID=48849 RepID=UPI0030FEF962